MSFVRFFLSLSLHILLACRDTKTLLNKVINVAYLKTSVAPPKLLGENAAFNLQQQSLKWLKSFFINNKVI